MPGTGPCLSECPYCGKDITYAYRSKTVTCTHCKKVSEVGFDAGRTFLISTAGGSPILETEDGEDDNYEI